MRTLALLLAALCCSGARAVEIAPDADWRLKEIAPLLDGGSTMLRFEDQKTRHVYSLVVVNEWRKKRNYPDAKGHVVELNGIPIHPGSDLEKNILRALGIALLQTDESARKSIVFAMECLKSREDLLPMSLGTLESPSSSHPFDRTFFEPTLRRPLGSTQPGLRPR